MNDGRLGMIATPRQRRPVPEHAIWIADNGCYGTGFPGEDNWVAWLAHFTDEQRSRCLFATAPDVVGDAVATLERSCPWFSPMRRLGYAAALVAQDGLEELSVPWGEFDVLFIGGSTTWKLGGAARELAREAQSRNVPVHCGRVNSLRRMRYAADVLGAVSCDGTLITFGPDLNLRRILRYRHEMLSQRPLWGSDDLD